MHRQGSSKESITGKQPAIQACHASAEEAKAGGLQFKNSSSHKVRPSL